MMTMPPTPFLFIDAVDYFSCCYAIDIVLCHAFAATFAADYAAFVITLIRFHDFDTIRCYYASRYADTLLIYAAI